MKTKIASGKTFHPEIAASGLLLLWVAASMFIHLVPHDGTARREAQLLQGADITPSVAAIFSRACINCHSEKTRWPWYGQAAPASWLLESDVKRARTHMNLSRWDEQSTTDQRLLLTAIGTVIENKEMPPRRYLLLHPEAKLTADETVEVIEWTRAERRRLRSTALEGATR